MMGGDGAGRAHPSLRQLEDDLLARWMRRMVMVGYAVSGQSVGQLFARGIWAEGTLHFDIGTADYAKFQDWGVGRGRPLSRVAGQPARARRPYYSWYVASDTARVRRLVFQHLETGIEDLALLLRAALSEPLRVDAP